MKSLGSTGSFLWALLLVLFALICTGNSFKQELWLYNAQDDAIQIHSKIADTSQLSSFLPYVTSACARGFWYTFSAANFISAVNSLGSQSSSDIVCYNFTTAASVKSVRHFGASDTDTAALSLYEGAYSGTEVFVTAAAHTGITNKITYIAATGTSEWKLFEGQELDGKSACFKVISGRYIHTSSVSALSLTTVGSVFKGCSIQEIENYKMLHASKIVNSN